MAQKIKKLSKKFIAFVCMITLVFSYSIVNNADATLASVSDTLSDSQFNTLTDHTIAFQVKQGALGATDTIIVAFEEDFDTSAVALADIDIDDGGGDMTTSVSACPAAELNVAGLTTDTITFTLCTGTTIADEAIVTIQIGSHASGGSVAVIKNPAAATCGGNNNSYVCDIDITTTGTNGETGTAQVAIVSGVTVSATVNEALTFVISQTAVGFGGITPGTLRYANTAGTGALAAPGPGDPFTLTYNSNVAGASITVKSVNGAGTAGLYSSSVVQTLTARSANTMSGATNGFAVYGVNSSGSVDVVAGFDGAGGTTAVTAGNQVFADSTGVGANVVDVDLIASAAVGTLGASDYATTLVFVATPVY
jgi:hypothetical protein